jgi:hypothetical protein
MLVRTVSEFASEPDLEIGRVTYAQPKRLSRLLVLFRPLMQSGPIFAPPRRAVDRELQEREPTMYWF